MSASRIARRRRIVRGLDPVGQLAEFERRFRAAETDLADALAANEEVSQATDGAAKAVNDREIGQFEGCVETWRSIVASLRKSMGKPS